MARSDQQLSDDFLDGDRLLTTEEVGELFRTDPKTVARWATAGRFPDSAAGHPGAIRTPGHIRIRRSVVRGLLDGTMQWKEVSDVEQE